MKSFTPAKKKQTLKRQLFGYMCILTVLLLLLFLAGMVLIGSFTNTRQRISSILQFQAKIFERQIDTYYDELAVMSSQLSSQSSKVIDTYLTEAGISFDACNDSETHISQLQERLIDTLQHKLWEADCTGTFIMLNAQVNSSVDHAQTSRSGLYLQRNSLETADDRVLLYRGLSEIGKEHNCMPHRKWRLEFSTELFPDYTELAFLSDRPLRLAYQISEVIVLPGTDQHVMLMSIPIFGSDDTFFGVCGFEINEGYFRQHFAQPSELKHAVFCLSRNAGGLQLSQNTLSAGILNSYYLEPNGSFDAAPFGDGLTRYNGENTSYIGFTKEIHLSPNADTSSISILIPESYYDQIKNKDTFRILLLILSFTIAAISLSLLFTHYYLAPLKKSLAQIKKKEYSEGYSHAAEIDDLFMFLAEQDALNEARLSKAEKEMTDTRAAMETVQEQYHEAKEQVKRLAYSRKDEVDPCDYENFKKGLQTLTPKEKEIFQLYIQGRTVKEIVALLNLQESTVRFHNKNIYAKLGVHSLKQLLRYAAIAQEELPLS